MRAWDVAPSPMFSLPGFELEMICIDVLHALDLGFSQLVLGNIIWEYMNFFADGSNQGARIGEAWKRLKSHYADMRTYNRLQVLTLPMLRKPNGNIVLKAKGAETRHLVPFGVVLARDMYDRSKSAHAKTTLVCVSRLLDFYMLMGMDSYNAEAGKEACRVCVSMYRALWQEAIREGEEHRWRLKPKAHMFQELAEYQGPILGNPRHFWTYADEDFVGWLAKLARPRGGPRKFGTATYRVMQRYRGMTSV